MEMKKFDKSSFKESNTLKKIGSKFTSGQVTIIGGSKLFHGAPVFALKAASRIVSMVYFASPIEDREVVEQLKSALGSFIWVSMDEVAGYIKKSDAVLIGTGMMRSHEGNHSFACDSEGEKTRELTLKFLNEFPKKKWLVDGGSLQVLNAEELPKGTAVSPNRKEFEMLFGEKMAENMNERVEQQDRLSNKYGLVILTKDVVSIVSDGNRVISVEGGNNGLVKGGVGDVIAGAAVGFMAKDEALFSLAAASYLVKKAAERLAKTKGLMFNSDDLADTVPEVYKEAADSLSD